MASPTNAQELQQFCCGIKWLRLSLPDITKYLDPIQKYLKTFDSSKSKVLRASIIDDLIKFAFYASLDMASPTKLLVETGSKINLEDSRRGNSLGAMQMGFIDRKFD